MFSSALKSFSSNVVANYEIGKQPVATSGAWRVFDGRKKSTNAQVSIFVFDRKSLDVQTSSFGPRASATSIRKVQDEVVERLKKEASSLARLRHPSILQLVEPVEDTRTGGLMFATEPVTASLAGILAEKDDQERSGGVGGRPSRYVVEDPNGTKRRRDLEMDELEIQKGLLQVAKGLEFLHESAGLVHGNMTPDAIYVNAKSDWKIAGLAFAGPPDGAEGHQVMAPISLSEVLYLDPRLPRSVQLNLDFASPDFVLDANVTVSADIFSLALLIVALYNFPHSSPVQTNGNQSTYKKIFSISSTTPSSTNDFLSTRPLPRELSNTLGRLMARRPADRLTAREFQQSAYFDNILVNTIRFLDALPAKTANEKAQFMRGLGRVMPQFPAPVLGKKVLVALLDEMKDKQLLPLILQNVFKIVKTIPSGRRVFPEQVLPRLRDVFQAKGKAEERDTGKEAGLMIILENIALISENCSSKEFKDDVFPIILLGMESATHSLVDASLQSLPTVLPILDFSTVKHDLFPVVSSVFSKTSSLSIKVRGLEALVILCGGSSAREPGRADDLSGVLEEKKASKSTIGTALDRFTMQEKIVPLLKGIKTKEPAVMMAALDVFSQVGKMVDTDFLATDVVPILWSFSLGPLLDLAQFRSFMDLIKSLSARIEREQTRKLQELHRTEKNSGDRTLEASGSVMNGLGGADENAFERLVIGNRKQDKREARGAMSFGETAARNPSQQTPTFSWSTSNATGKQNTGLMASSILQPQRPASRSITPDTSMASFPTLQPSNNSASSIWATPSPSLSQTNNPTHTSNSITPMSNSFRTTVPSSNQNLQPTNNAYFSVPPPPLSSPWQAQNTATNQGSMSPLAPAFPSVFQTSRQLPQFGGNMSGSSTLASRMQAAQPAQKQEQQKQGLDKYQSLL